MERSRYRRSLVALGSSVILALAFRWFRERVFG